MYSSVIQSDTNDCDHGVVSFAALMVIRVLEYFVFWPHQSEPQFESACVDHESVCGGPVSRVAECVTECTSDASAMIDGVEPS